MLPLKKVVINSDLRGATSTTEVELTYVNPLVDQPLECTYTFPLDKNTVLAKFDAIIDDRVVYTKVTEKEKAKEQYDDAVAGGKAAVLAERSSKKEETLTVKLGNLLPGQTATLKSTIIGQLEVVAGHYAYILPVAFYPDYKKHGVKQKNAFVYEFSYNVRIHAKHRVVSLSVPENAEITPQNEGRTEMLVSCSQPSRTVDLYYKDADMLIPSLHYARVPDSD